MTDEKVLPEAGGIAWTEIWGQKTVDDVTHDVKINLTSRAATPAEALDQLFEALLMAKEKYHMNPFQTMKAAPGMASSAPAVAPVSAPAVAPASAPVATTTAPAASVSETNGVFNVVKMTVTPRADGKVKLDFYEANHKYPDIYSVKTPEAQVALLANTGEWTPAHFAQVATYDVSYKVQWRNSENKTSKGNFYKDIIGITI
jgi:hypothetical protein